MNHKEHQAAFEKGMNDRNDNHSIEYNSNEDRAVYPHVPNRKRFAEKEGDDKDLKLAFKRKKAVSSDRMPILENAYSKNGINSRSV